MKDGALLGKEAILAAEDMATEIVEVPEWGGSVRVKALSGFERDRYERSLFRRRGKGGQREFVGQQWREKLSVLSIVDENGNRVFEDTDFHLLTNKGAIALDRITKVALKLSGISESDIDEMVDSFELGQPGDSTSG